MSLDDNNVVRDSYRVDVRADARDRPLEVTDFDRLTPSDNHPKAGTSHDDESS